MKATFPFCNVKQAVGESNYQGPAPAVKKIPVSRENENIIW